MALHGSVRVLIAEDDAIQLKALQDWLHLLRPNWQVIVSVGDAAKVLHDVDEWAPDLLLLDIHLGGSSDDSWIRSLPTSIPIIFVTGDPNFALDAFDLQAVDYILKPVSLRRLKSALDRAALDPRIVGAAGLPVSSAGTSEAGLEGGDGPLHWLSLSKGHEVILAAIEEVIYLRADLKYTRVVSQRGEGLVRMGISELCQRIVTPGFVRIHRSIVVNLNHVSTVRRNDMGQMDVHLRGRPEVLRVSKTFQHVFRMS